VTNVAIQEFHFNRGINVFFGTMLGSGIAVLLYLLLDAAFHRNRITGSIYGYMAVLAFGVVACSLLIGFAVRLRLATPAIEMHPDLIVASAFFFDRKVVRWDEVELIKDISRPSGNWNNGRLRSFKIIGSGRIINFNELYTRYPELIALINEQIAKLHIRVLVQRYPRPELFSPGVPAERQTDRLEMKET
jgi:hypothetical protein